MPIMNKGKEWLSCRDILWFMVFCGFSINYMLRINISIAIVAMVLPRHKPAASVQCNQESEISLSHMVANFTSHTLRNTSILESAPIEKFSNRYAWNEYEQGLVLGAYYWLNWITQIPGGLLARKYGTKKVFGYGNMIPSALGFLIPYATRQHLYVLVCLRALQGFIAGVAWPAMHSMTAKWIPPDERSKFVSAYLGSSVGAALAYPLCAAVISIFGWEAVFSVTSAIGVVWYLFWQFLVYDSPQEHPRISTEERNAILSKLPDSVTIHQTKVPWRAILTSGPMWVICFSQMGTIWGFLTFMTQSPTYFNFVHGWNVNATGILSGLPHLMRTIFAYFFSTLCDWLLRTRKMSRTNVRKLATFMCSGVQGLFTLGLAYSGCHPYLAAGFMIAGTAVNGAVSSGALSVLVDIGPNYASVLLGICGVFIGAAGFLSPVIVSALTNDNQTIGQWRLVYLISAVNLFLSCVLFMFFGTAKLQPWNQYYVEDAEKNVEEMQALSSIQKPKESKEEREEGDGLEDRNNLELQ